MKYTKIGDSDLEFKGDIIGSFIGELTSVNSANVIQDIQDGTIGPAPSGDGTIEITKYCDCCNDCIYVQYVIGGEHFRIYTELEFISEEDLLKIQKGLKNIIDRF
jgi:hypothetical protein